MVQVDVLELMQVLLLMDNPGGRLPGNHSSSVQLGAPPMAVTGPM